MEKYIKRRYGFNVADVRDAIISKLIERDVPYPMGASANAAKFILTPTGATLEWDEESES